MSCGCISYECVLLGINLCSSSAILPIIADATGVWQIELMGVGSSVHEFEATEGEMMELPSTLFNENYTHKAVLRRPDGSLYLSEGICLKIHTHIVNGIAPIPPIPALVGIGYWAIGNDFIIS